jgi:hypothetical protein
VDTARHPPDEDRAQGSGGRGPDPFTVAIAIAGLVIALIDPFNLPAWERLIIVAVCAVVAVALRFAIPTLRTALHRLLAAVVAHRLLAAVVAVVVLVGTGLALYISSRSTSLQVIGTPALVTNQSNLSNGLELVTAVRPAGLVNCWSGAKIDQQRWTTPHLFGRQFGTAEAVTLTQSDFGAQGNLEVIARYDDHLMLYWREFWRPPTQRWGEPLTLEVNGAPLTGVSGVPALVQVRPGHGGDFLLVSPRKAGGLGVYHRDNSQPPPLKLWSALKPLGGREPFTAVAMTRSAPDVIDLVAQGNHRLLATRYDHGQWTSLVQVATTRGPVAAGRANLALTRSARGLELVVPDQHGGLALYWRSGQAFGRLWQGPVRMGQAAGLFDGVAVAAASSSRRIDIVARQQESLQHFFRTAGGDPWRGPSSVTCDETQPAVSAADDP